MSSDASTANTANTVKGLVIERLGDRLLVAPSEEKEDALVLCSQRSHLKAATLVVGDRVLFQRYAHGTADEVGGVVVSYEQRRNVLQRTHSGSDSNGAVKTIAANVNTLVVVVASSPVVPTISIDELLVAAHVHDMQALLVVNKCDLPDAVELSEKLKHYRNIGYPTFQVSANDGTGVSALRQRLFGQTSLFVGQSGVGKSSLVNALVPATQRPCRVGDLVAGGRLGKHTTSTARLYHLDPKAEAKEDSGSIIDCPGVRAVSANHLAPRKLTAAFLEIAELAKRCRFRNCDHVENTEGCAVQQGVIMDLVHPDRLANYLLLRQKLISEK